MNQSRCNLARPRLRGGSDRMPDSVTVIRRITESMRFIMTRLSILVVALFVVLAMACNKSSQESPSSKTPATQAAPATAQSPQVSPDPVVDANSATPVTTAQSATSAGMNPPHGQPNHRCDIPVGAPLNSPAGPRATPPAGSQPTVQAQPTATATAPGMNPPHGQPNHRCDIPVGAPLNSAPTRPK